MHIYHYASIESWRGIKDGSWQSRDEPGLGACLRVCKDYWEEGAGAGAVFGLLEPEPPQWKDNPEFPLAWRALMGTVGKLLLKFEPTDELVDKSFIIDWAHRERALGGHINDIEKVKPKNVPRIPYAIRAASEKDYWESKIPLSRYIEDADAICNIQLPEVITTATVPFELITVAETQPRLANLDPFTKKDLIRSIQNNPELACLGVYVD